MPLRYNEGMTDGKEGTVRMATEETTGTSKMTASTEDGYWAQRLAALPDKEVEAVVAELRRVCDKALRTKLNPSWQANTPEDIAALREWRQRHPNAKKRKAKAIRKTPEYQEILDGILGDVAAAERMRAKERSQRLLAYLDGLETPDTILALAQDQGLLDNGNIAIEVSDILVRGICMGCEGVLSDEALKAVINRMGNAVTETLCTGDISEYCYDEDYDDYYWGHTRIVHYEIHNADDLLYAVGDELDGGLVARMLDGRQYETFDDLYALLADTIVKSERGSIADGLARAFGGDICESDYMHNIIGDYSVELRIRVCESFDRDRVLSLLSKNPRYAPMFEELRRRARMEREMEESILRTIPANPIDLYPVARSMERHFVLHVGPTNSGKTHDAIDALGHAASGIYLAPLRLLAYEQYERLNAAGCACSLLTGEEEVSVAGAAHTSSTIEMLDFSSPVEVAVIDEAQMMEDRDRGSHWTEAILGVPAKEVHVCMAPEAEAICKGIIAECGDTLEVIRHERMTPLTQERERFAFPKGARKGDAIIVFSRRAVHAVATELTRTGRKVSMVYGSLPHEVRHREAERFAAGETDVVVATDAIGMGMNLPIKRVVFLEQAKFDGRERRLLTGMEIRQIAGRAGRYGIHEAGLWTTANEGKKMGRLISAKLRPLSSAPIGFVRTLLGVDGKVSELMAKWVSLPVPEPFAKTDLERETTLAQELESAISDEDARSEDGKRLVYRFATMPFKENMEWLYRVWLEMFAAEVAGDGYEVCVPSGPLPHSMEELEAEYAYADLLHQYCRTFGYKEHYEAIAERRRLISDRISEMIARSVFEARRCRECGNSLPWNWPYPMCDPCHDRLYPRRGWYGDGW